MLSSIEISDRGPAVFELDFLMPSDQVEEALRQDDLYREEVRDACFDAALAASHAPLPRGPIRALVSLDEWEEIPPVDELGQELGLRVAGGFRAL